MRKQNKKFILNFNKKIGIKTNPQFILLRSEVDLKTRLWFLLTNIFRYLLKGEIKL